jgi:hypothetical protein
MSVLIIEGFKGVPDGSRWVGEKGRRYTHSNYDALLMESLQPKLESYTFNCVDAVAADPEVATPQGGYKFPLPAINWPIKFDANTTTRRIMNLLAEAYTARIRSFYRTLRNFTPEQTYVSCFWTRSSASQRTLEIGRFVS